MVQPEGHVHVFGLPTGFDLAPFDLSTYFLKRLDMRTIFGAQDEPGLGSFRQALDLPTLLERAEATLNRSDRTTDSVPQLTPRW